MIGVAAFEGGFCENNNIISWIHYQLWKNSSSVINWFENTAEKDKYTFIMFDIVDFYPSITDNLLTNLQRLFKTI